MINEMHESEPTTLKDMLMSIPYDTIESFVKHQDLSDPAEIEKISLSIKDVINNPNACLVDSKYEFESIKGIIESYIPEIHEIDSTTPEFKTNMLIGNPDWDKTKASAREIFANNTNNSSDDQLAASILRDSYFNTVPRHFLKDVLFVKNYNKLSIDLRETIHWLIEKGVKVIIARENDEQLPTNAATNLSKDFVQSTYLKSIANITPNLHFAD